MTAAAELEPCPHRLTGTCPTCAGRTPATAVHERQLRLADVDPDPTPAPATPAVAPAASWAQHLVRRSPGKAAARAAYLRTLADRNETAGQADAAAEHLERADQLEHALHAAVRCIRCGRRLTDPDSKARGIGPDCLKVVRNR